MAAMQSFRNLKVWEKAHTLTLNVYASTKSFPREELYGMTSQMRRASASVGMNIAEGCCRKGDVEMGRFVQMAMGSASELEYQLLLARDLHYLNGPEHKQLDGQVVEVKRMLSSLLRTLKIDRLRADS
jgi:four helix bundle protein